MRGSNIIYHRPYIPANRIEDCKRPFICRLAPFESGFSFEWLRIREGQHYINWKKCGADQYHKEILNEQIGKIENLETDTDYEFYIEDENGVCSNLRIVRTGQVPAGMTVVNYLHPKDAQYEFSGRYLCSPSLVRLSDGVLLAGMDLYGPKMAQNLTILFRSEDNGKSWKFLTDLYPFYWGSLFVHRDVVYMLGLTTEYGNLQITRSLDGGKTWEVPVTIFYGSNVLCENGGMHRAPMQMYRYKGRMYTSCEYGNWTRIGLHEPSVLSIDEDADLMIPENWVSTGYLPYGGKWKEDGGEQGDTMEGNIVVAPDGKMYNILRWKEGEYLKMEVDPENPEEPLKYRKVVSAPVSNAMFRIIPWQHKYLLITNRKTEIASRYKSWSYRNVLSIFVTEDLENFTLLKDIVNCEEEDADLVGFQYPAVIKEEDGICLLIRSAFNHANNNHDSNYMLFYHITNQELKELMNK